MKLCSSFIRHRCLFTIHLWKMLDFSALLSKDLYAFVLAVSWLNYALHVAFYVVSRNFFVKTNTDNQPVKIKSRLPSMAAYRISVIYFYSIFRVMPVGVMVKAAVAPSIMG